LQKQRQRQQFDDGLQSRTTGRRPKGLMIEMGFEATPETHPESLRKALADAVKFWEPLVTQLGLKID
jgi:hypothetical protein